LSLTRDRLAGLYPDGLSGLDVRRRAEGGTEVEISLPLRLAPEERQEALDAVVAT
jgi:hypothetical protein